MPWCLQGPWCIVGERGCLPLLPQVKALLSTGLNRPRKGADVGDHPPITPMRAASEGELGESHDDMMHHA